MKFHALIVVFFVLVSAKVVGQEYSIKDRLMVKVGYSNYPWLGQHFPHGNFTPCFNLETNYGFKRYIEAGIYLGYSRYSQIGILNEDPVELYTEYRSLTFYGVNINIHLLPLIEKSNIPWINLYLSSKIGGFHHWNAVSTFSKNKDRLDYGLFLGLALYPLKHWGGFIEYGYGNYVQWRSGLSLIF